MDKYASYSQFRQNLTKFLYIMNDELHFKIQRTTFKLLDIRSVDQKTLKYPKSLNESYIFERIIDFSKDKQLNCDLK